MEQSGVNDKGPEAQTQTSKGLKQTITKFEHFALVSTPPPNHARSCELNGAPLLKKISSNMTPVNMTLFGNRVFADVIKLR